MRCRYRPERDLRLFGRDANQDGPGIQDTGHRTQDTGHRTQDTGRLILPINVVASIIFINGKLSLPAFGVTGAAIGSAIAVTVQVGFLVFQLFKSDRYLARVEGWRGGRFASELKRHLVLALPIAATFFSAGLAGHICNLIYAKMTLNSVAAMTLIAPWIMATSPISMLWTQATGIIVAQLLGRKADEPALDKFLSAAWRGAFTTAGVGMARAPM